MFKLLDTHLLFGINIGVCFILVILSLPVYFTLRKLLKKIIKIERTRKITTWGATLIVTPLIYGGLMMVSLIVMCYHPNHGFNREKWLSEKDKRYEYSKNLIDSKILINKTKTEVRQILGDEGNKDNSDYWIFYLGFSPGIANVDADILDIEFKSGKVFKVGQHVE